MTLLLSVFLIVLLILSEKQITLRKTFSRTLYIEATLIKPHQYAVVEHSHSSGKETSDETDSDYFVCYSSECPTESSSSLSSPSFSGSKHNTLTDFSDSTSDDDDDDEADESVFTRSIRSTMEPKEKHFSKPACQRRKKKKRVSLHSSYKELPFLKDSKLDQPVHPFHQKMTLNEKADSKTTLFKPQSITVSSVSPPSKPFQELFTDLPWEQKKIQPPALKKTIEDAVPLEIPSFFAKKSFTETCSQQEQMAILKEIIHILQNVIQL